MPGERRDKIWIAWFLSDEELFGLFLMMWYVWERKCGEK